ncbi:MAG: antitoxin VapB family protein [Thaumarchaeota archaeon]|nr:antitoxin VapB family protein [Nitrososphaerota archaeon]
MGTKNIAISEEAYQRLKAIRKPRESFTEVIERITRSRSILELAGVLSKTEGAELKSMIKKIRAERSKRIHETIQRLH